MASVSNEVRQLYRMTGNPVSVPVHAGASGIQYREADTMPVMFWPDGKPCLPANMYLMDLFIQGHSTRNGGTVKTYAQLLSIFIRFIGKRRLSFEQVTDEHIREFASELQEEFNLLNPAVKRRGGRQVNKIIRKALEFLLWYQPLFSPDRKLVVTAGQGGQVNVEYREITRAGRKLNVLWHVAMVAEDIPKVVRPIAKNVMMALLEACQKSAKSAFVIDRRLAMIKLMGDVGARRVEVANVTIAALEAAERMMNRGEHPMLELITAKRPGGKDETRLVPIPPATLKWLLRFFRTTRRALIKKLKLKHDPGWLFMSTRGDAIEPETMTQEIALLRRLAGITEAATLHMFRHRWITLQVLERLKSFVGKKMPMELARTILTEVASLTGHKDINSLWCYIDFAFQEMGVWNSAEESLRMKFDAEAALRDLQEIGARHPGWKGLGAEDQERISELLVDLVQALPDGQMQVHSGQAER